MKSILTTDSAIMKTILTGNVTILTLILKLMRSDV